MKEKIVNIIYEELSYIYCWNCRGNDDTEFCGDDYHRKYMNWAISKSAAERIANKIIKVLDK